MNVDKLPDDIWVKIMLESINLHPVPECGRVFDLDYGANPGIGISCLEATCSQLRKIVVRREVWKEACALHCSNFRDVVKDADPESYRQEPLQADSQGAGSNEPSLLAARQKSAVFKRVYHLLSKPSNNQLANLQLIWTSSAPTGFYMGSEPIEGYDVSWHRMSREVCETEDSGMVLRFRGVSWQTQALSEKQEQKRTVGIRFLFKIHPKMYLLRSIDISYSGYMHTEFQEGVRFRLFHISNQAMDPMLQNIRRRPLSQTARRNATSWVQGLLQSSTAPFLDHDLHPDQDVTNSTLNCQPSLSIDGYLLAEFYCEEGQPEYSLVMTNLTMTLHGVDLAGIEVSDTGMLSCTVPQGLV